MADAVVSMNAHPGTRNLRLRRKHPTASWAVLIAYAAVLAFLVVPNPHRFPTVIVSVSAFALAQLLFPRCRPVLETPICPLNWALFVFLLQLVILPLMITFLGPSGGTLPFLPSDFATNVSLLLSVLGYIAFCLAYQLSDKRPVPAMPGGRGAVRDRWSPSVAMLLLYIALGAVGLALSFGSLGNILNYFTSPPEPIEAVASTTLRAAAPNFLKPFIGFAFVAIWCKWVDRCGTASTRMARVSITVGIAAMVVLVYGTYNFNRGAFAVPLVAMAAVYFARIRRVPIKAMAGAGVATVLLLAGFGLFQGESTGPSDEPGRATSGFVHASQFNLNEQVQVYGAAPQFIGYLLERTDYARAPYWGRTLIASTLFPAPILGKPFRAGSGVVIYNNLIYGPVGIFDQNLPIQGELFINFHAVGVVLGFLLLGYVTFWLQRAFAHATTALDMYICMYTAIWLLFLIVGSLSAVSQIFIYFFWPIYGCLVFKSRLWHRVQRGTR